MRLVSFIRHYSPLFLVCPALCLGKPKNIDGVFVVGRCKIGSGKTWNFVFVFNFMRKLAQLRSFAAVILDAEPAMVVGVVRPHE